MSPSPSAEDKDIPLPRDGRSPGRGRLSGTSRDRHRDRNGNKSRSGRNDHLMNVPFVTGSDELDAKFVALSTEAGLVNLKGHRSVGGMRASIYNAMPRSGVQALVEFMEKFEKDNA